MLMEQLKALKQSFNEDRKKVEKGSKSIQLIQKELKLAISERKPAENSI